MRRDANLSRLVQGVLGDDAGSIILDTLEIDPRLSTEEGPLPSRAVIAMAMNTILMHGLLRRAPTGAAYVEERRSLGERIVFDHGALRTILFDQSPTGALPPGRQAFTRLLEPLGYAEVGLYPLQRLKMTGRAFAHRDFEEAIPQFFLSELHVDQFSPIFQSAAARVFGTSIDPLSPPAIALLERLSLTCDAPISMAEDGLPGLVQAFERHHELPSLEDYRTLKAESAEAAWISTEGNAFNHATDRVANVEAVAEAQRHLMRPIKDKIEVSSSGRVRQTAFHADPVERAFMTLGGEIALEVPGSFYEFISRDRHPDGRLDLAFDSSNAQGIFKMTAEHHVS